MESTCSFMVIVRDVYAAMELFRIVVSGDIAYWAWKIDNQSYAFSSALPNRGDKSEKKSTRIAWMEMWIERYASAYNSTGFSPLLFAWLCIESKLFGIKTNVTCVCYYNMLFSFYQLRISTIVWSLF